MLEAHAASWRRELERGAAGVSFFERANNAYYN